MKTFPCQPCAGFSMLKLFIRLTSCWWGHSPGVGTRIRPVWHLTPSSAASWRARNDDECRFNRARVGVMCHGCYRCVEWGVARVTKHCIVPRRGLHTKQTVGYIFVCAGVLWETWSGDMSQRCPGEHRGHCAGHPVLQSPREPEIKRP